MIYIKIEMWPLGNQNKAYTLGEAYIWNNGLGSQSKGQYKAILSKKGGFKGSLRHLKNIWKETTVKGFPRLRLNAWDLTYRALCDMISDRNEKKEDKKNT